MEHKHLSPEESMAIIEHAIRQAKQEKSGAANYYVLWGSLLCVYALSHYVASFSSEEISQFLRSFSWIVFPVGGILSYLQTRKDATTETRVPLQEKVHLFVWSGVAICFAIIIISGYSNGISYVLTSSLLLIGLAAFITGGILKLYQALTGGILCMVCAALAMHTSLEYQFLLAATGMLTALVIPGLFMFRRNTNHV